jgi:nitric oxide reductase NorQ protein
MEPETIEEFFKDATIEIGRLESTEELLRAELLKVKRKRRTKKEMMEAREAAEAAKTPPTIKDSVIESVIDSETLTATLKTTAAAPKIYQAVNGFLIEKGISKMLSHNIKNKVNTMLLGPTGVGKTEMIAAIAQSLKMDYTVFDMGTMTDPIMSLIGTHAITVKDGVTSSEFKKSRFSEVIQKPGIVVLDELSRAAAGSNNLLFPCLDFRRELPMEYSFEDYSPIKIHPDCVFVATANTGSQYTGTHKLDKALIDRFMILEIEPLNAEGCKYVLENVFKDTVSKENYSSIVDIFFAINVQHEQFVINFNLSMRHLKMITSMVANGFTIYDAYYATCKGIGGKAGIDAVSSIINPYKK